MVFILRPVSAKQATTVQRRKQRGFNNFLIRPRLQRVTTLLKHIGAPPTERRFLMTNPLFNFLLWWPLIFFDNFHFWTTSFSKNGIFFCRLMIKSIDICTQPDGTVFFLIFTYLRGRSHWNSRDYGSNVAICHFLKPATNKGDFRLYFLLAEKSYRGRHHSEILKTNTKTLIYSIWIGPQAGIYKRLSFRYQVFGTNPSFLPKFGLKKYFRI